MRRVKSKSGLTSVFYPNYRAKSVKDMDFSKLRRDGVDTVVFDIDRTLVPHGALDIDDETLEAIKKAVVSGHIDKVAVATNRRSYNFDSIVKKMSDDEIVFIHARGILDAKPSPKYFRRLFKKLNVDPSECVMVGDKTMTDVLGGNLAGMKTLKVEKYLQTR